MYKRTSQERDVRRGYMGSTRDWVRKKGRLPRYSAIEHEVRLGDLEKLRER